MISKNYPEVCKEEVASFISTLQDKDWDIFKEVEKGTPSDDWQKKYKGSSILREESVTR
jgi:succinate dehydrogenase flavin-adding protein (antitoxin of CptAB toxin-antitoxin module)